MRMIAQRRCLRGRTTANAARDSVAVSVGVLTIAGTTFGESGGSVSGVGGGDDLCKRYAGFGRRQRVWLWVTGKAAHVTGPMRMPFPLSGRLLYGSVSTILFTDHG